MLRADGSGSDVRARYDYVEGIRALACLTVVLNHAVAEAFPILYRVEIPSMLSILQLWFAFGHHAVTAFIVVSGFCLGLPLAGGDFAKPVAFGPFMARRCARILPPYYAALVISILVCFTMFKYSAGMHFDFSAHPRPSDIAAHFLLIQNVFGTGQINYSLWSIATELQIYMLFPFLVALVRKRQTPGLTVQQFTLLVRLFLEWVQAGSPSRGTTWRSVCERLLCGRLSFLAGLVASYCGPKHCPWQGINRFNCYRMPL